MSVTFVCFTGIAGIGGCMCIVLLAVCIGGCMCIVLLAVCIGSCMCLVLLAVCSTGFVPMSVMSLGGIAKIIQILHVVIMIIMLQDYGKIAGADAGFAYLFDFNPVSLKGKGVQGFRQHMAVCTQIQQGSYGHIAADTARTFQV